MEKKPMSPYMREIIHLVNGNDAIEEITVYKGASVGQSAPSIEWPKAIIEFLPEGKPIEFCINEKEVEPLKHKFILNDEQTKRFQHEGWTVKAYVCSTCNCIKVHSRKGRFTTSTLMRNGRISEFIDCVDMENENLKTID